jgi:hypothetical protein
VQIEDHAPHQEAPQTQHFRDPQRAEPFPEVQIED